MKNKFIVYPFLFAIFPVFSLLLCNVYQVPISHVVIPLVCVLIFTSFLLLIFQFLFHDSEKTAIFVSFFNVVFFSFRHIDHSLKYFSKPVILFGSIIFLYLVAFYLRKAKKVHSISKIINVIGIVLVSSSLLSIIFLKTTAQIYPYQEESRSDSINIKQGVTSLEVMPNIYYIILDGYARGDVLKEIYQYDNSEFINFLEKKGFYVADKSFANYCQTVLSIPSALSINYVNDIAEHVNIQPGNPLPLYHLWRNNTVFSFFRRLGYKTVTFDAQGWNVYLREKDVDIFYKTPNIGLLNQFQSELLDTTPLSSLLQYSLIDSNMKRYVGDSKKSGLNREPNLIKVDRRRSDASTVRS